MIPTPISSGSVLQVAIIESSFFKLRQLSLAGRQHAKSLSEFSMPPLDRYLLCCSKANRSRNQRYVGRQLHVDEQSEPVVHLVKLCSSLGSQCFHEERPIVFS